MMTLPRATISPWVIPSRGTSLSSSSTTRSSPEVISSTPCRPLFADGDERRGLSESVNMCNRPAQFFFESLDGGRGGRRAGGDNSDALRRKVTNILRRVGQGNQNRRRRAQHGYLLLRH